MKHRIVALVLATALLLTGCASWLDGEYVSVKLHAGQTGWEERESVSVSNYQQIRSALAEMAESGAENGILSVEGMDRDYVISNMELAVSYVMENDPVCAYAVEEITYELGTSAGVSAVAVSITYRHGRSEIQRIKQVRGMDEAKELIGTILRQCEGSLVMRIEDYEDTDLAQVVRDYADANPAYVMEIPQVTANVYPEKGSQRVVEMLFSYQTSVETLRSMQGYVQPVFSASSLYVSGEDAEQVKFSLLYAFLMERNDYDVETSITPAYSLLRHGVGDSKAFAVVYAAMCRRAGMECMSISGTRKGEPWFWNIICQDGIYYHVDLLQSHSAGTYRTMTDEEMAGYVWDYSAYPACGVAPEGED